MRHNQGNGLVQFWKCSYCRMKTAVNLTEEWEDTWWDGTAKKVQGIPEVCPECANYEPFVEQANLTLIEDFYSWGYRQWSNDRNDGWRIKIEIDS